MGCKRRKAAKDRSGISRLGGQNRLNNKAVEEKRSQESIKIKRREI